MGINISHTTCVHYAAQDGRANDLLFHLERAGKQALDAIPGRLDQRTPLHLAAAGGHTACIQVLKEAGEVPICVAREMSACPARRCPEP